MPGSPVDDVARAYSQHIEDAQTMLQEGSTSLDSVEKVRSILEASSLLCRQERCVQETIMGGTALSLCAQISKNQAQALDTNLCAFDPISFSNGIRNALVDPETATQRPDWKRLARKVSGLFKRAPVFSYMYGSFKPTEPPPKERKEKSQRQTRVAEAAKKKPEQIKTVEVSDKNDDKAVQRFKKLLGKEFKNRNDEPMDYFECVLHPESFARTVENIFNLSFLIRDHFIRVENPAGSPPMIHLVKAQDSEQYRGSKKRQCIVSITIAQWQELVQVYNITTPMLP